MNDAATVSHAVSGGGYGSVTVPDVTVTVPDDETASASVALTVSNVERRRGGERHRHHGDRHPERVGPEFRYGGDHYEVSAGTASTGDFAAVQDFTLTITAGQISGTANFRLTPVDDTIDEDDETVRVAGTVQGLTVTSRDGDGRGRR